MGILSSMYTGVTGIQGLGEALAIYGDNIANASTVGFKTSRPEFQDVIAKSLKGLLGGNQIGRGTRLAGVTPIFSQGSILQTESATDVAISGEGFYVVDGVDGRSFTRDGQFRFNKDGELITSDGMRVQGFQADDKGKVTSQMGSVKVSRTVIDAKGTNKVDLFVNLDLRAKNTLVFDPERPDQTNHFATGVTVYDTAGAPHVCTMYFNKTEDGIWEYRVMAKGEEVTGGVPGKLTQQATGKLSFDVDGRLKNHEMGENSFNFVGGALPDQKIEFNFGKGKEIGGDGLQVTQYGANSEAYKTMQDGYTVGTLTGLTFNDDGILAGVYSNGENINLAQLALAKFENPESLFKMGQNRFRESRLSGSPTIGAPQQGGRGRISPKTVESSTTDIAQEFINLMNAQRNFQANTRVISVADQMMQDILALKRT